jgi:hypothetical protein
MASFSNVKIALLAVAKERTPFGSGITCLCLRVWTCAAPRNLDLKHFNGDLGLFQPLTSNNFTFSFAEPFVALDGNLGRHIRFDIGTRQEEISITNQDLRAPSNSFNKLISTNMPRARHISSIPGLAAAFLVA